MTEHEFAAQVLSDAADLLDRLGIPFVLEGGTLLGAVRDGDFCEDDWVDIDLTTLEPGERSWELVDAAKAEGWQVRKVMRDWTSKERRTAICKIVKDGPWGAVTVDVFFKRIKGEQAWWTRAKVLRNVPARHYIETDALKFYGREYRIPSDVDAYLTLRYGDWRRPMHRSKYNEPKRKQYKREQTRVRTYDDI